MKYIAKQTTTCDGKLAITVNDHGNLIILLHPDMGDSAVTVICNRLNNLFHCIDRDAKVALTQQEPKPLPNELIGTFWQYSPPYGSIDQVTAVDGDVVSLEAITGSSSSEVTKEWLQEAYTQVDQGLLSSEQRSELIAAANAEPDEEPRMCICRQCGSLHGSVEPKEAPYCPSCEPELCDAEEAKKLAQEGPVETCPKCKGVDWYQVGNVRCCHHCAEGFILQQEPAATGELDECPQCQETAWDGCICHRCGAKAH
jgi:hypothetical protein